MPGQYARPKGFVDWNPQAKTRVILSQVQEVLNQYQQYGAMTCRQIFYRLVGQYDYAKTENAYNNLCEYLVRARRAQLIPFGRIRDDGTTHLSGFWVYNEGRDVHIDGVDEPESWWESIESEYETFFRRRDYGQEYAIELWCEAGGMAPMLAGIVRPYGVPVYSTGGFSSVTVTREISRRAAQRDRSTIFLHVGDYDPSGESIFESMAEDAGKFFYQSKHWEDGGAGRTNHLEFLPVRVALTEEQVEDYNLPTAPPKGSDSRSANWVGETCQLEAMAPDDLAEVIKGAVEERFDMDVYHQNLEREEEERETLREEWRELLEARS